MNNYTTIGMESNGIVKASKKISLKAAEEIVGVFEAHFAKLPPKQRAKRERTFDKVLSNIGSHAKSATPAEPRANQRPSLHS
jgi:hypothetical protein